MIALNARRLFFQFWYCSAFLLILALIWHAPLCAAEMNAEEWEITADRMVRYENPASVIAEGHVILEKKEKQAVAPTDSSSKWKLTSDSVEYCTDAFDWTGSRSGSAGRGTRLKVA